MDTFRWFAAGCLALGAGIACAEHGERYAEWAEVVDVRPQYTTVRVSEPRRECWDEDVYVERPGYRSHTPILLGGIVGGVLGHELGGHHHHGVATAAGTLLGASVGRDVARRRASDGYYETRERCRTVHGYREEERVDGYRVTYIYDGRRHVTYTDYDPGDRIRVDVAVRPRRW
jgi:uncharacterized protein YcfJ